MEAIRGMTMRVLLLLFICISIFLSGMVFESKQDQESVITDDVEIVEEVVVQVVPNDPLDEQEMLPMNFTQQTASFLEGIVNGLYTLIVNLLHDIASIFFSIV